LRIVKIPKQISLKKATTIILISILLTVIVSYYAFASSPSSTFTISPGVYPGAPWMTVWKEGNNYYVKDANGKLVYSDTDASAAINYALNSLPDNGRLYVRGEGGSFQLSEPIFIYGYLKHIIIDATLLPSQGHQAIVIGNATHPAEKCIIEVNRIDGTDKATGEYGIHLRNGRNNRFYINHLINLDIGIYIHVVEGGYGADNTWYINLIDFCGDGIVIYGYNYTHHAEGNRFYGGAIFNCTDRGLWIKAYAKHTFFNMVADYNSPDIDDDVGYTTIISPFVRNIDRLDLDDNAKSNSLIITGGGIAEGGFISQESGSATFTGDGSKTYFDIEHHLSEPAHSWYVTLASYIGSVRITYVEEVQIGEKRYLRVHLSTAPADGTEVVFKWHARIHMAG